MTMGRLVLWLASCMLLAGPLAAAFELHRCDAGTTHVSVFTISACPDLSGSACYFEPGQTVTFDAEFVTSQTISEGAKVLDIGITQGGHWIHLKEDSACNLPGLKCPTQAGQVSKLTQNLMFKQQPDNMSACRFELQDSNQTIILCFEFPAKQANIKQQAECDQRH